MKIYRLDYFIGSRGSYPKCKVDKDYDYGKYLRINDRYFGLYYDLFPPKEEIKLHFMLGKKTPETDLLSLSGITGFGFFINEKLKILLEQFQLCPHVFYPSTLRREEEKEIREGYYWLHLDGTHMRDLVDYSKSKFHIHEPSYKRETITLNSYEDYEIFKKNSEQSWGIFADEIHLKEGVEPPCDIFVFGWGFDLNIYITEKLKKTLVKNKIKGIEIEIADNIVVHSLL